VAFFSPHLLNQDEKASNVPVASQSAYGAPSQGQQPTITFDRFVRSCVVVRQITESFSKLDTDRDGWIQINYEGFMETALKLP